jgi:hypothetical protein
MPVSSPLVQSPALTALRQSPIPALRKRLVRYFPSDEPGS